MWDFEAKASFYKLGYQSLIRKSPSVYLDKPCQFKHFRNLSNIQMVHPCHSQYVSPIFYSLMPQMTASCRKGIWNLLFMYWRPQLFVITFDLTSVLTCLYYYYNTCMIKNAEGPGHKILYSPIYLSVPCASTTTHTHTHPNSGCTSRPISNSNILYILYCKDWMWTELSCYLKTTSIIHFSLYKHTLDITIYRIWNNVWILLQTSNITM